MPQNQEEIEAKLAAYIDGELDAAGRAEIEKHLQANPQHRTLIHDLMQQRELVRSLPRANAPAEISETLQGQLERSVLLGSGVDAGDDTSMRISPWPHRGAIAAIVLLTAGLSFLVYKVLPSSKPSPELAVAPQNGTTPGGTTPATLSTEPPAGPEQPIASAAKERVFTEKLPQQAAPPAVAEPSKAAIEDKSGPVINAQGGNQTAVALGPGAIGQGNFSNNNSVQPLEQKTVENAPAVADNRQQWCVVVTTDNPAATDAQVRAFLIANQIHFQPVDSGALSDGRIESVLMHAATQPTTQLSAEQSARVLPSTLPTLVLNNRDALKLPTTAPGNFVGSFASSLQPGPATAPIAALAAPATTAAANPVQIAAGLPTTQPTRPPTTGPTNPGGFAAAATQPTEDQQTVFFCPDVSTTQANDLKSMLALRAGQSAQLVKTDVQSVYIPLEAKLRPDGSVDVVRQPTTQQLQQAVDQQVVSSQVQQFGAVPPQSQAAPAQEVSTTSPASQPANEGKVDLTIVMRPVGGMPSTAPATQPAVELNSPPAAGPTEPAPALKLP